MRPNRLQVLSNIKTFIFAFLIGISMVFLGCSSTPKKEGRHPDFAQLPSDKDVNHIVDIKTKSTFTDGHLFHPDNLQSTGTIDSKTALGRELNQSPKKIDVDQNGNIYLVHRRTNYIHVYDSLGHFKYKIGGSGRGPGEFQRINTFDFDAKYEKLYVLGFFEVEVFTLKDNRFEPTKTISTYLRRSFDLCILDDKVYISGYGINKEELDSVKTGHKKMEDVNYIAGPVHSIDLSSGKTDSFGFQYKSYSNIGHLNGLLSNTILACNKESDTIVAQFRYNPFMFGYTPEGELKWTSKINNFNGPEASEFIDPDERPGMYQYTNKDQFHRFYWFRETNSKYELIQIYNSLPRSSYAKSDDLTINPYEYKTILVNSETGALFYSNAYPLIGAIKDDKVITIDRDTSKAQRTIIINETK